jgi:hypothetical protein
MTAVQGNGSPRHTALLLVLPLICLTVAFCHLTLSGHEIEPTTFYLLQAREPYIYRILLPTLAMLLPRHTLAHGTHLPFPLEHGADAMALCVDWLALTFACVLMAASFRRIAAGAAAHLRQPGLVVPVFIWMVIFDYILVPNNSMYYPYDFPQLLFFAGAVWLGVSGRGGYWGLPLLAFIGALNKEDALFVPVIAAIYAAWVGRLNARLVWSILAAGAAVVLAKYVGLVVVRHLVKLPAGSPTLFENHLAYNLHQLMNPIAWFAWLGVFGGGLFILAMPLARINRLKIAVIGLMLAYIPVILVIGESRELRLMGALICPVILPVLLTLDALLYEDRGKALAASSVAPLRLAPGRVAAVAAGVGVAVVAVVLAAKFGIRALTPHPGIQAGSGAVALAPPHAYQDLQGCESTQIHSCKTADGQDYDCLFTNLSQARIELSEIRIWNYDANHVLIHQQPTDTQFAIAPGQTAHFEFHDVDGNAVHGRLCRVDPESVVGRQWSDAT